MYLLTSIAIINTQLAWAMYLLECLAGTLVGLPTQQTFRWNKAELGMESPKLWFCRTAGAGK